MKARKTILADKIETSEYNQYVYGLNGAFMILQKKLIKEIIKEGLISFLYGEEILIAETVDKMKKKIFFTDKIELYHEHGVTTGKTFSKQKFDWMKQAYVQSKKKGYNFYKI